MPKQQSTNSKNYRSRKINSIEILLNTLTDIAHIATTNHLDQITDILVRSKRLLDQEETRIKKNKRSISALFPDVSQQQHQRQLSGEYSVGSSFNHGTESFNSTSSASSSSVLAPPPLDVMSGDQEQCPQSPAESEFIISFGTTPRSKPGTPVSPNFPQVFNDGQPMLAGSMGTFSGLPVLDSMSEMRLSEPDIFGNRYLI